MLADNAKSLLPNLKSQVNDTEHQIKLYKTENSNLKTKQDDLKQEVDIFIAKYLKQEGIEKSKKTELKQLVELMPLKLDIQKEHHKDRNP